MKFTGFTTNDISNVLYASTDFLALPFEKKFMSEGYVQFAASNWPLCIGIVVSYLLFITVGKKIMESQKPFDIQLPLALWNGFLCLFSFIGMCRTVSSSLSAVSKNEHEVLTLSL
jgi:hypothetical protein